MQQVQASIVSLVHFKLHLRYLTFSLCFCTIKLLTGDCLLEDYYGGCVTVVAPYNEGVQLTKEVGETTMEVVPLPNEAAQFTKEAR